MKTQKLLFFFFSQKSVCYSQAKVYKIICMSSGKAKKSRLIGNIIGLYGVVV